MLSGNGARMSKVDGLVGIRFHGERCYKPDSILGYVGRGYHQSNEVILSFLTFYVTVIVLYRLRTPSLL